MSSNYYEDGLKDIKKQHGDFLRQQIKMNEEKKQVEKHGRVSAGHTYEQNSSISYNSNNMYNPGVGRDIYESYGTNNQREGSANNRSYGDYLRQQMEEKKRRQSESAFDSKSAKILALQEKMSSQAEIPFGRGGAGAPLVGKNGQVIASRKPNISNVDYDSGFDRNNVQRGGLQQQATQQYAQQPLQKMSIADQFAALIDRKVDASRPLLASNVGTQQLRVQDSFTKDGPQYQGDSVGSNQMNYRRMNRGLLAQENEQEGAALKKELQKNSIQQALMQQMEEKQRKKLEEKKREQEEEMRIEDRVRIDRMQMEKELQEEEEIKKKKVLQVTQQNEHIVTQKKKHHHLNKPTSPLQKQVSLQQTSVTDRKIPVAQTQQQYSQQNNQSYQPQAQTVSAFNHLYPSQTMSSMPPSLYSISNTTGVVPRPSYLEQRSSLTSEAPRRDIIPEIEGMKMQIQEQYKRMQVDMQRVKVENFQAIDDRNKGIQRTSDKMRMSIPQPAAPASLTAIGSPLYTNDFNNHYSMNNNNNSLMATPKHLKKSLTIQQDYMQDYNEGAPISLLQTESKMIPMDLIDQLRNNDQLTMSQLMNYDNNNHNSLQTPQQSRHSARHHSANHQQSATQNQHQQFSSSIPTKDLLPTVNNSQSKEIESILKQHTLMFNEQQDQLHYNQQSFRATNAPASSTHDTTTFNKAAKELLENNNPNNYNGSMNGRVPSFKDIFSSSTGMQEHSRNQDNYSSNNAANHAHHASQLHQQQEHTMESGETNFMRNNHYHHQHPNSHQEEQLDYSQYYAPQIDESEVGSRDRLFDYREQQQQQQQQQQQRGKPSNGGGNKPTQQLKQSSSYEYDNSNDSDEIKKQKALREIKDRFNLSTVNEEWNEHTKRLSTILETGKYADNKELYESLKAVEDPDFVKLDELIRLFKSDQQQQSQQQQPPSNNNSQVRQKK